MLGTWCTDSQLLFWSCFQTPQGPCIVPQQHKAAVALGICPSFHFRSAIKQSPSSINGKTRAIPKVFLNPAQFYGEVTQSRKWTYLQEANTPVSWQEALPHPPLEQLLPDALMATRCVSREPLTPNVQSSSSPDS